MADIFIHASTSRSNVLSPDTLQIPVSDARSEPWSAKACADATRKRRRATSTSMSSPTSSSSSDKEPLITRIRISKGIYQEGKHIVVTPQHPAVSECLAHCRKTWSFPPAIPDTILVLCALEVFFHPSDPAHWLFWSNEKKESSVELVNRICSESPPLIEPTRLWDESMLFSLSLLHGQAWHDALRHEPWYHTLVGCNKEDASVPNRPNLRKRKPAPEQETSRAQSMSPSEDSVDAAGPSTKRIRRSTSRSSTLPSSTRNSTRVIRKPAKFRDPDFEGSDVASTRSTTRSPSTSPTSLPSEASSAVTRRTASILSARTVIGSASDRSLSPLSDLTTSTLVEPEEPTQPRKRKARVVLVDIESTAGRKDKEKDNPEENTIMTRARARSTRR